MAQVTHYSPALARYFIRFYDADGPLYDVTVALPCSAAAYQVAAQAAASRFGYVPEAEIHSVH